MKPTPAAVLDARTPGWPVVEATLTDPPTVTVSGITTPLDGADPQRDLVLAAATQARGNGRPIRVRVATPGGDVHHLIVTTTGRVVPLPQPGDRPGKKARSGKARSGDRGTPEAGANTATAGEAGEAGGQTRWGWGRFPRPVRWAALGLAVLTAAALVVIVGHGGDAPAASAADPAAAPVPPAGAAVHPARPAGLVPAGRVGAADHRRHRPGHRPRHRGHRGHHPAGPEHPGHRRPAGRPPGPVAVGAGTRRPDPVRRTPGLRAPVRPGDHPDRRGHVALIADTGRIRYWPLTGGPDTAVDLPTGGKLTATPGGSVLLTLPGDRVGYLHHGAVHTVQVLPRTSPAAALDDGAVVATQPAGAWWTLRGDTPPTAVTPTAPPGAGAVQRCWRSPPPGCC